MKIIFYLTVLAISIFALSEEVSAQRWCRGVSDHRCLVDPCIGRKIIKHIRQNNDIPFPQCCVRNICGKSIETTTKSSKRLDQSAANESLCIIVSSTL